MSRRMYPTDLYAGCPCFKCDQPWDYLTGTNIKYVTRMSLCPECGSKRCPGAQDHSEHGKEWKRD